MAFGAWQRARRPARALLLLGLAILIGLGAWQIDRREQKRLLLTAMADAAARPAQPLPAEPDPAALSWAAVTLMGRPLPDKAVQLRPRTESGKIGGHWLLPVERAQGAPVWVLMGFLAEGAAPPALPEQIALTAVARRPPQPGAFTPENRPEHGFWTWADLPALSRHHGLPPPPALLLIADPPPAGLEPVPARPDLPNDHLRYAVTWFTLAAALLLVFVLAHPPSRSGAPP